MVVSKLSSNINYPEPRQLEIADKGSALPIYEIVVNNVEIAISVGAIRRGGSEFETAGVSYFPIYLIKSTNRAVQIGVFEIKTKTYATYLDEDGDVDVSMLDDPIIYGFATAKMLADSRKIPDDIVGTPTAISTIPSRAKTIPPARSDIFLMTDGAIIPAMLSSETRASSNLAKESYDADGSNTGSRGTTWIARMMKSTDYSLTDNEGGGDCFFATIRDAFSSIAQQTTVNKIRNKLSVEATEDVFETYKTIYDDLVRSIANDTREIKKAEVEYKNIRERFSGQTAMNREEKIELIKQSRIIKSHHDALLGEKRISAGILAEYKMMKGVDTLDKFKRKIKTSQFWADTWAISTLERILNIKFIILSSETFHSGDIANVLQCGQLNDSVLENQGVFNPEYYIILDYLGQHYKLIGYKRKMIFGFDEIPYDIKTRVVDKCLEHNAGPFSIIPDFVALKRKMSKGSSRSSVDGNNSDSATDAKYKEELEEKYFLKGLYDPSVVFQYYIKSTSRPVGKTHFKPLPGNGVGETIDVGAIKEYSELSKIPDWRKKMSAAWVQPFTLDNHSWSSVTHYYQASKFKVKNPGYYLSFTIDSGTELSKLPEMAVAAGGKSGKYGDVLLRPVQVEIDPDFYGDRSKNAMAVATTAKFSQNADLGRLLVLTKSAKLVEYVHKKIPTTSKMLMVVREKLRARVTST